jgi:O-antigen/teichoic acid export membrane protein
MAWARTLLTKGSLGRHGLGLFVADTATNAIDYGFHILMGRLLVPADFSALQALNSAVLIIMTVGGVLQPVVARQIVLAPDPASRRGIHRAWLAVGAGLGSFLSALAWLFRAPLGSILGVPDAIVAPLAAAFLIALSRPAVVGALQGTERFLAMGLVRAINACTRILSAAILVSAGAGLVGSAAALPIGSAASLLGGLLLLGKGMLGQAHPAGLRQMVDGARLAVAAFFAYGAYMLMMNADMIWVNRMLPPDVAGGYATMVLLRRVVALLPGAVIVVMYPRAAAQIHAGSRPDRLLLETAAIVAASGLALTALYRLVGPAMVRIAFGSAYHVAGSLLAWTAAAMVGYGLASMWMSLSLSIRPGPYTTIMCLASGAQILALSRATLVGQVVTIFTLTGWALALAGLLLYMLWLRPSLSPHPPRLAVDHG